MIIKGLTYESYRLAALPAIGDPYEPESVSPESTRIIISNASIRELNSNSRSGKARCENDQHASMEYAGNCYSR